MGCASKLPREFTERMSKLAGFDYDEFIKGYEKPPFRGLRVNTLRCTVDEFIKVSPFKLGKLPFCDEGFYIGDDVSGKSPLHHAGVFYLQEPSAMSAVTALDVHPGMKVLDLCAAPGGKSTQAAAKLEGCGFILCNEIIPSRANILLSNIERCGIRNAAVTSEKPEKLCPKFEGYFDRVLVDAPCSGEGMFRREPAAAAEWTPESPAACARRQLSILELAAKTVAENGILVYSTCTFSPDEDEGVIDSFLKTHPEFKIEPIERDFGTFANPVWANADKNVSLARRVFPKDGGEGHFVARMKRVSGGGTNVKPADLKVPDKDTAGLFSDFFSSQFNEDIYGTLYTVGDKIYILPKNMPDFKGLNLLRAGVLAGILKGRRIEPQHALYMAADAKNTAAAAEFSLDDQAVEKFLHGEQIDAPKSCPKGYVSVKAGGFIIGFGKMSEGVIKNHYPKGLRNL